VLQANIAFAKMLRYDPSVSGYIDDVLIRVGGNELGVAFLQKPFSSEEIGSCIRRLLDPAAVPVPPP
jgi:hypothetical protein